MLKMKCPKCSRFIVSALLAEIESITCEHCQVKVQVQDVLIFAHGFSFHRNDLVKRLFRYKKLINEVVLERELLDQDPKSSRESKRSLEKFRETLEEMMAGARDHMRIEFTQVVPVKFKLNNHVFNGRLNNLSTEGVCIRVMGNSVPPRNKSHLSIHFTLPENPEVFSMHGIVIWSRSVKDKGRQAFDVGMNFEQLNQEISATLWKVIVSSVNGSYVEGWGSAQ